MVHGPCDGNETYAIWVDRYQSSNVSSINSALEEQHLYVVEVPTFHRQPVVSRMEAIDNTMG